MRLTKHSLEDLIGPGEESKNVPWRKWNMKEETKLELEVLLVSGLSDPVGGQHEVIVVHPD